MTSLYIAEYNKIENKPITYGQYSRYGPPHKISFLNSKKMVYQNKNEILFNPDNQTITDKPKGTKNKQIIPTKTAKKINYLI